MQPLLSDLTISHQPTASPHFRTQRRHRRLLAIASTATVTCRVDQGRAVAIVRSWPNQTVYEPIPSLTEANGRTEPGWCRSSSATPGRCRLLVASITVTGQRAPSRQMLVWTRGAREESGLLSTRFQSLAELCRRFAELLPEERDVRTGR